MLSNDTVYWLFLDNLLLNIFNNTLNKNHNDVDFSMRLSIFAYFRCLLVKYNTSEFQLTLVYAQISVVCLYNFLI